MSKEITTISFELWDGTTFVNHPVESWEQFNEREVECTLQYKFTFNNFSLIWKETDFTVSVKGTIPAKLLIELFGNQNGRVTEVLYGEPEIAWFESQSGMAFPIDKFVETLKKDLQESFEMGNLQDLMEAEILGIGEV